MSLLAAPLRRTQTTATRSFSTTPTYLRIAPESPNFIKIPRSPNTKYYPPRHIKGKLPRPKNIFPSSAPDKTSPAYLDSAAPKPSTERNIPQNDPETAEYIRWKMAMAESRRQNLREGLEGLAKRKAAQDAERVKILKQRSEAREALLAAKERDDVRLTLPSVLSALREPLIPVDPERAKRIEEKKQRRLMKEAEKAEEKMRSMHELYTNASGFLLTEAQIDQEIEEKFSVPDIITRIFPMNVAELLSRKEDKTENSFQMSVDSSLTMDIAAVFTGGKIPGRSSSKTSGSDDEKAREMMQDTKPFDG